MQTFDWMQHAPPMQDPQKEHWCWQDTEPAHYIQRRGKHKYHGIENFQGPVFSIHSINLFHNHKTIRFYMSSKDHHYLPGVTGTSKIPSLLNSVYSMQVTAYSRLPSPSRFSIKTFTPSAVPTFRSHDAKPNFYRQICGVRFQEKQQ